MFLYDKPQSINRILPVMLIIQLVLFFLVILGSAKISLALFSGIAVAVCFLVIPNPFVVSLILSVFIAIILPHPFGRNYLFKIEEIFPIFTLIFFIFAWLKGIYNSRSIGKIGHWLIGFLFVVLISTIIGVLKERSKILIFDELMMFLAWGIYFFVVKSNITHREIKYLLYTLIISSFIVNLFYIYEFIIIGGVSRFRTDQQHIFNIAIPILFAVLLYDTKKLSRILAVFLMIPMIFAVYITLTRSLWLLIPLTIAWQYLYFIREGLKSNKFKQALFPLLIIVTITILGFILLTQLSGIQNMLGERFASFGMLEYDFSLLARAELSHYVFERVRMSPLLGTGLADFLRYQYFPTLGRYNVYWLDSSYLQVLWKTGIIGLFLFLGFLFFFLKRTWFILKKSKNVFDKIIGSGIFFSMLGLVINGIQSGILVGYRFNFVWAILFGIIEIRAQSLDKNISSLKLKTNLVKDSN